MTDDILVFDGGSFKSLGDGRFGGRAIVFGDETKTDLSPHKDFMNAATDYWVDDDEWGQFRIPLIYNHGLDPEMKRVRIGSVTLAKRDDHIWAEGQLKLRAEYEAKHGGKLDLIRHMVEKKQLGFSTGVPGHLVEREKVGDAHWLKSWPVRIAELSLTPQPAEPRTWAVGLKSLLPDEGTTEAPPEAAEPPETAGFAESLRRAESALDWAARQDDLNGSKLAAIKSLTESVGRFRSRLVSPGEIARATELMNRTLSRLGS